MIGRKRKHRNRSRKLPNLCKAFAPVALATMMAAGPASAADPPMHKCDPVTEEGWQVVPERQTLGVSESAPYRIGASWYVDRTTSVLPFCHYYNSIGIYSLNSYSLDPVESEERVEICRDTGAGRSVAVAPYGGPCPPPTSP